MTEFGPADVAFIGLGRSVPCWYRCAIPAQTLGIEWSGVNGNPMGGRALDGLTLITGNTMSIPNLFNKKVVILQQPKGQHWRQLILELRTEGVKVIYEVDDWLDSVGTAEDHENREFWSDEVVDEHYECMSVCDAMIVTTERLKRSYSEEMSEERIKSIPIYVCRNGLDLGRYQYAPKIDRDTINIGWAGGVGHKRAVESWSQAIRALMNKYDNVGFVSIGAQHARNLDEEFPGRVLRIPPVQVELFPATMRSIDIAIGPAQDTSFFWGKSDLRYLEASALSIPGVYDRAVYGNTVRGQGDDIDNTKGFGFLADDWEEAFTCLDGLVQDDYLLREMGRSARYYVEDHRSAEAVSKDWIKVFEEVTE